MTAYPSSYKIDQASYKIVPNDGSEASNADDGTVRIRRLYPESVYDIEFVHPVMESSDAASLDTFYSNNRTSQITFTDPFTSTTYDVYMREPPRRIKHDGIYASVRVRLRGKESA